MLPFHRVFEQEKVDWKIKCFRVIKKAQDWKNKSKRLGVNAIKKKKADTKYRHTFKKFRGKGKIAFLVVLRLEDTLAGLCVTHLGQVSRGEDQMGGETRN